MAPRDLTWDTRKLGCPSSDIRRAEGGEGLKLKLNQQFEIQYLSRDKRQTDGYFNPVFRSHQDSSSQQREFWEAPGAGRGWERSEHQTETGPQPRPGRWGGDNRRGGLAQTQEDSPEVVWLLDHLQCLFSSFPGQTHFLKEWPILICIAVSPSFLAKHPPFIFHLHRNLLLVLFHPISSPAVFYCSYCLEPAPSLKSHKCPKNPQAILLQTEVLQGPLWFPSLLRHPSTYCHPVYLQPGQGTWRALERWCDPVLTLPRGQQPLLLESNADHLIIARQCPPSTTLLIKYDLCLVVVAAAGTPSENLLWSRCCSSHTAAPGVSRCYWHRLSLNSC